LTATQLLAVLRVQDLDTALDQHRHRRATLPEREALISLDRERGALAGTVAEVSARRDEVAARQDALEGELNATQARISDINRRLYGGMVSATRDLQAMAAEVEHLQGRSSDLEDRIIEVMELREPLDAEVAELDRRRDVALEDRARIASQLAASEATVDAEISELVEQRAEAASSVPPELLAVYEGLRKQSDGVGAARLIGSTCAGCHLMLPATEIDRIKRSSPDAVFFCDQCGRILVRP
jgi:predicted  nucleic acid-binding Zn-ribbon protein